MLPVIMAIVVFGSCAQEPPYSESPGDPELLHRTVKHLTDVIVHDIFSPPVASRIYAYPAIAAYEIIAAEDEGLITLSGQLNGLEAIPQRDQEANYDITLAAMHAYLQTGKALIFSEARIEQHQEEMLADFAAKMPEQVYERSLDYGNAVSMHILEWANNDNYKETRTFPKYTITDNPAKWQPTPPDYMEGIEPHWKDIRTFILDSSTQFVPQPPTTYSTAKDSRFFTEAIEVYEAVKNATPEMTEIAEFWDCNPYVSHHVGHVMFATKKITPGGHWIGITGQACRKAGATFNQSIEIYTRVSIALADAFISCWDEKYRSNLVRPETFINENIDPEWVPTLQTPPFPEHTSGHSVISSAAGEVLTDYFGDSFAFTDSVEVEYGLPVRNFDSFRDAYAEAAISRLYGGIHYMPAIEYGVEQGKNVGAMVIARLNTSTRR